MKSHKFIEELTLTMPRRENSEVMPNYEDNELGETFGEYDYLKIPVDKAIVLPQIRGSRNISQAELTQSIRDTGRLLNPIDIALMSRDQLINHLNFINGVWKTNIDIDQFEESSNELFPVLIAGHSRLESIKTIQKEDGQPKSIVAKIHKITSSADFLSLQLAENTYNNVKPERRAMAIVEMFLYGFNEDAEIDDINHWSSNSDFIRKNGNHISKEMLRDGLALTKLPPEIRDFIFSGNLYYGAAVEIGKNSDVIMDYVHHRLGEDVNSCDINKAYKYELAILINNLIESRKNSKGSLKRAISIIRKKISYMEEVISPPDPENHQISMINKILDAPNIQREEYLASLGKDYREAIKRLKSQPINSLIDCLKLNSAITGEDLSDDIREVQKTYESLISKEAISNFLK